MLTLVRFEYNHCTIAPSSGLRDISLMTHWEAVNSYGDDFLRWDEGETTCIPKLIGQISQISLIWKIWSRSNFLEAKQSRTPMTEKISIFAGWASMLVVQSVQSSKSHALCHFYLAGKIAFSIKVRDRLLTELWLRLQSPWDDSTDPPLLHSSKPPTYTQTYAPTHPCTGTHTNKCTLSPPLQSKAYSHIKSIKFTLLGLSHKKNISPLCPCSEETL